jgi:hypothetical protein
MNKLISNNSSTIFIFTFERNPFTGEKLFEIFAEIIILKCDFQFNIEKNQIHQYLNSY